MLIDKILDIETEELLNFRFSKYNFLIWPFIRKDVIERIYYRQTNSSIPMATSEKSGIFNKFLYIYNLIKYNPFRYNDFPIVFTSTQRVVNVKRDGKFFNRAIDYLALGYPNISLVLEFSERKILRQPRYFNNIAYEDYIYFKLYLKKIFTKFTKQDEVNINNFIEYINSKFNIYLDKEDIYLIKKKLIQHITLYPFIYKYYRKLLSKLKPSILISVGRGAKRVYIFKAAKDMGIKVAEVQHGIITKAHPLYNYSDAVANNKEFKTYLPDYLLTFGEFWNNNMRDPTKKVIIGSPHFTEMVKRFADIQHRNMKEKYILFISQGTLTKVFVDLAKDLIKKISKNEYKIIFRLHPGEVPFEERYKELYYFDNIEVDKHGDIYELIYNCDCMVGCYSTTIYEALAFKKPIFIIDNQWSREYIPKEIGNWFKTSEELYRLIISTVQDKVNINKNINYFWDPNWKKNYRDFIEKELSIKQ